MNINLVTSNSSAQSPKAADGLMGLQPRFMTKDGRNQPGPAQRLREDSQAQVTPQMPSGTLILRTPEKPRLRNSVQSIDNPSSQVEPPTFHRVSPTGDVEKQEGFAIKLFNKLDELLSHPDVLNFSSRVTVTLGGSAYLGRSERKGTIFGPKSDYDLKLVLTHRAIRGLQRGEGAWKFNKGPKFMSQKYRQANPDNRSIKCPTLRLIKENIATFFINALWCDEAEVTKLMGYFKEAYGENPFSIYVQGLSDDSLADVMEHSIVILDHGTKSIEGTQTYQETLERLSQKPIAADTIQEFFDKYQERYEKIRAFSPHFSPLKPTRQPQAQPQLLVQRPKRKQNASASTDRGTDGQVFGSNASTDEDPPVEKKAGFR